METADVTAEPGNCRCHVFSVHIASDVEGLRKQKLSGGHSVEKVHGEGTFVRLATPTISIVYDYFGQSMSSIRLWFTVDVFVFSFDF
jgi:hypothetical protein